MTNTKHTPYQIESGHIIFDNNGYKVCVVRSDEEAAYIVKAVNFHKRLADFLNEQWDVWQCNPDHYQEEIETYGDLYKELAAAEVQ